MEETQTGGLLQLHLTCRSWFGAIRVRGNDAVLAVACQFLKHSVTRCAQKQLIVGFALAQNKNAGNILPRSPVQHWSADDTCACLKWRAQQTDVDESDVHASLISAEACTKRSTFVLVAH